MEEEINEGWRSKMDKAVKAAEDRSATKYKSLEADYEELEAKLSAAKASGGQASEAEVHCTGDGKA